jgi:hypothetical protein
MRIAGFIIALTFFCAASKAQEILPSPDARLLTTIPFKQFSGGVIIIQACFEDGKDSLNFILDTGSGNISLDSSTCVEFNVQTTGTDTTITGIAGVRRVPFAFNRKLRIPGLTVNNLNFHINDYSLLTSVYGVKIDGIIGYAFFSRYIIKLNFDDLKMEVYSPGRIKYPNGGTTLRPVFTSLPIQYLQLKDKRRVDFNFYIDSGAGLCFLISDQFEQDSSILLRKRKPVITQAEGMGGKMQMRLTVIRELKLGPYKFHQVPTYLYKDIYNVTSYPFVGGLIGNEILRRFNLVINYPQREIHLLPNTHYGDAFEYGYTGFSIYVVEGKIVVEDIVPGSPAAKAGFIVGDEVIGVDGNFSGNIQTYKNLLQEPDRKMKIIIRRDGVLQDIVMVSESIL